MGVFDSISKTITDASQTVTQKSKEMADVVKFNSLIGDEEKKINDIYNKVGKIYLDNYIDEMKPELSDLVGEYKERLQKIEEYRAKVKEIKEIYVCPNCGQEIPNNSLFCPACGTKVEASSVSESSYITCKCCGNSLPEGSLFCTSCGNPLETVENKDQ